MLRQTFGGGVGLGGGASGIWPVLGFGRLGFTVADTTTRSFGWLMSLALLSMEALAPAAAVPAAALEVDPW